MFRLKSIDEKDKQLSISINPSPAEGMHIPNINGRKTSLIQPFDVKSTINYPKMYSIHSILRSYQQELDPKASCLQR